MYRRTLAMSFGALLPLMSAGCGAFGGGESESVSRVDDLVRWVERVHVESEVALETVRKAADTLEVVTSPEYDGDPVQGYEEFVATIRLCEAQSHKLRSTIDPMKSAAEPVFEQWSVDLLQMSNVKMRLRSHMRMEQTRERYDAVVTAVDPTSEAFEAFTVGLRDIALFLAHDFNAASVADIQDDVRALRGLAADLQGRFDVCLNTARDYVESSSLPAGEVGPGDPGAERGFPAQPGGSAPNAGAGQPPQPRQQPPILRPTQRPVPEPAPKR